MFAEFSLKTSGAEFTKASVLKFLIGRPRWLIVDMFAIIIYQYFFLTNHSDARVVRASDHSCIEPVNAGSELYTYNKLVK